MTNSVTAACLAEGAKSSEMGGRPIAPCLVSNSVQTSKRFTVPTRFNSIREAVHSTSNNHISVQKAIWRIPTCVIFARCLR